MKISIIGAGNVGGTTALRIAQEGLGEVVLIDIQKGLSAGKVADLLDARSLLKLQYRLQASDDIAALDNSSVVVMTAGLTRKPGMTREDLLLKNAAIVTGVCSAIREKAPGAVLIMVTNPLDLMTRLAVEVTGFGRRVMGMGISLDAARFAQQIAESLDVSVLDVAPQVIGTHGEGMLPLVGHTTLKGESLEKLLAADKAEALVKKTVNRGLEIVTLLGSGSAYYAPSAAILELVRAVVTDEKKAVGVSALLGGEYGIKDVCIGVPCRIGAAGIEQVRELALRPPELQALRASASMLQKQYQSIARV